MAENEEVMSEVAGELAPFCNDLGIDYYFKASFDKANRTTLESPRGPGLEDGLELLYKVKNKYGCKTVTDIHETWQAVEAAAECDMVQIPAMLCRQTDLIIAAATQCSIHGTKINIKKGQFLAPDAMQHIANKALNSVTEIKDGKRSPALDKSDILLCERGTTFGYGDLTVDMRSLPTMAATGHPVIFDATHSTQKPPAGGRGSSSADRKYAGMLARAAMATSYIDGVFMEVHPNPDKALSDGPASLNINQAKELIQALHHMYKFTLGWRMLDEII